MISETSELSSVRYRDSVPCHRRNNALPTLSDNPYGCRMCLAYIIGSCKLVLVVEVAVATTSLYEGIHSENSKLSCCQPICGLVSL